LRLPFRHIGAARHEFKRFMRPAKMNFVVAMHPAMESASSCENEKLTVFVELKSAIRERGSLIDSTTHVFETARL
jgi:hypothetical protein